MGPSQPVAPGESGVFCPHWSNCWKLHVHFFFPFVWLVLRSNKCACFTRGQRNVEHIILVSWLWWALSLESVFHKKFKVGIDFLTTLRPGLRFIFFFLLHSAGRESLYVGWGRQKTVQGFSCLAPRCELHLVFNKIIKKSDFLVLVQMCCSCQAETTTRPSQEKETSESERLTFRIRDADLLFLEL